jgi:hypothetical protein
LIETDVPLRPVERFMIDEAAAMFLEEHQEELKNKREKEDKEKKAQAALGSLIFDEDDF